jgi:hypothetical protein
MHYARIFIAIAVFGAGCACATFLLALPLTPEQEKAAHYCDGVFLDRYVACLESHPLKTEECTKDAYEAYKICRKNSGLPMQKPPRPPKVRVDQPAGKPSTSGASPTPKPLRHLDGLGSAQTQTLTKTSPTPTPKPKTFASPSHRR